MDLFLRPTVIAGDKLENDFVVIHEGRAVGRIRLATERTSLQPGWDWHITVPLPVHPWCNGTADDLDSAKARFREAWEQFYGTLDAKSIELWHHTQDASKRRFKRTGDE